MIGRGSQGSVIQTILDDCNRYNMKSATKYDPRQIIEKVWYERESVASSRSDHPSYIWWSVEIEEGEIRPQVDLGNLPHYVVTGTDGRGRDTRRYVWVKGESENVGDWFVVTGISSMEYGDGGGPLHWMLTNGLSIGQRVLSRVSGHYSRTSYEYDEWDIEWRADLIYAEPHPHGIIPVFVDTVQHVAPQHWKKSLRIEGEETPLLELTSKRRFKFIPHGVPKWFA